MVQGTDGSDFKHRESIAEHYQISALNKGRLRTCVFSHLVLAVVLVVKIVIDVLRVKYNYDPKVSAPLTVKWGYRLWLIGCIAIFIGFNAIRKNKVLLLQVYFGLVALLSIVPTLLPIDQIMKGYPMGWFYYCFSMISMQVHIFSLIFSWKLIVVWKGQSAAKAQ